MHRYEKYIQEELLRLIMVQRLTQTAKAVQIISNRVLLNYALQKLEILFVSPQYNCSYKY